MFNFAQRLYRLALDGSLSPEDRRVPGGGARTRLPWKERKAVLAAALQEYLTDPALNARDLHERCVGLDSSVGIAGGVLRELAPGPSPRLVDAGRWLVANGTDRGVVLIGLSLLAGNAGQQDVTLVKTIGLLPFADHLAVQVLAGIPGARRDLMWLAERSRGRARTEAVRLLATDPDLVVRDWVLSTPRELLPGDVARRIAEQRQIPKMLSGPEADDALWDGAGNLLLAMTSTDNYQYEITRYEQAPAAYEQWVSGAVSLPVTLERAVLLAMVRQDLSTGPAAVVTRDRGRLADEIREVLVSRTWRKMLEHNAAREDPVQARRAAWVIRETEASGEPGQDFAIRVVVPDPKPGIPAHPEARIMIGGIPVIAAAFDKGPAGSPEYLVHSGRLRATETPHEVRLAEAWCTEGCCGALYVTIVRDGPDVVWKDWRSGMKGDPPPEARLDAAAYDRELSRAEQDYSWEWPARTAARLVAEQLASDPGILGRWDCRLGWCTAWLKDFGAARLTFTYPGNATFGKEPWIQFGLIISIQGQDPGTVAAQVVESIRDTDPKTLAEMIGGSKGNAEKLGLTYKKPVRWQAP
ncbi:MAG TPA: hypothetical protein VF070_04070 [Streptosporangiaceae bacterium]